MIKDLDDVAGGTTLRPVMLIGHRVNAVDFGASVTPGQFT